MVPITVAIALFIIGGAIGYGIAYLIVSNAMGRNLSRVYDQELATYKFTKDWAKITDDQYNGLRDYVGGVVDLLKQQVDILIDTDTTLTEAAKEMATAVDNAIQKKLDAFTSSRLDCYDVLREDIDSMQTTSDSRWDIIHDYIVSHTYYPDGSDNMLESFLRFLYDHDVELYFSYMMTAHCLFVQMRLFTNKVDAPFYLNDYKTPEEAEKAFFRLIDELYNKLINNTTGGTTNEHEEMATGAGASEGGDAGHQETEQAEVLSGEGNRILVQRELEKDRFDDPSETQAEEA